MQILSSRLGRIAAMSAMVVAIWPAQAATDNTTACKGTIYLSFDTGSQSQAVVDMTR